MRILHEVVLKYILWKVALCAFAIAIFTAMIAIILFKRKSPAVLIKESKNKIINHKNIVVERISNQIIGKDIQILE
ncbi:MAG: hypothetical protein PUA71_10575 [Eubacteriales bacterium]|nr:hypothetical protein [Eubacteriales bacterium]